MSHENEMTTAQFALKLESILGDVERWIDKSVDLVHKRLDRIDNKSLKRRGSKHSTSSKPIYTRGDKKAHLTSSRPKPRVELSHEESFWETYQRLLHQKQMESNKCHHSESFKEEVAESIPNKGVTYPIEPFFKENGNEETIEGIRLEKEMEKSDEMSGKKEEKSESALILSKNVRADCFPNELTIALFSVSSFMQIKQSHVELILACSIPKSIVHLANFHGVCLLGVRSIWCPFIESNAFTAIHAFGGSNHVHLQDSGADQVPRVCNAYVHLALSPREVPTSPNLPWCFASVFKHEFSLMGYTLHHFEDPYLMTTSDQVEHTLKLVRKIQGSTRVIFQHSKWFLHWMKFLVSITRLTRRHVTLLVIIRASICGQIALKRRGMIRIKTYHHT